MPATIHATCIVIGERGILIRGASGAGKSALARALIGHYQPGGFARLVADDRVVIEAAGDRLIASPHPRMAGQMEQRGIGIVAAPFEPACILALVIDLQEGGERMPDSAARRATLAGISLPRLSASDGRDALPLAITWLAGAGT